MWIGARPSDRRSFQYILRTIRQSEFLAEYQERGPSHSDDYRGIQESRLADSGLAELPSVVTPVICDRFGQIRTLQQP